MKQSREQIIQNLEALRAGIASYPARLFNLDMYENDHPCGTLYCAAGLIPHIPRFKEMGVTMPHAGSFVCPGVKEANDALLDVIFGDDSYYRLFCPPGTGIRDGALMKIVCTNAKESDTLKHGAVDIMTDPEEVQELGVMHQKLALARIDRELAIMTEPNSTIYA